MTRPILGFCSISALDRPLAAAARVARQAGCDGVEVTGRPPHLDPAAGLDAAREAGRAVRDAGVSVVAYGSYLGRFGGLDAGTARQEVALAEALGAPLLRVWAEPQEGPEQGFAGVVTLLRAAADAARDAGVTVVVERHAGSHADTAERTRRLLGAIDRENVALNYQVLDFLAPDQVDAQPADAADLVPLARYFHLKNYQPNPEPGGRLLPGASLAEGVLDYAAILRAAFDAGYAGPLTLEFLSMKPIPLEEKLAGDVAFVRDTLGRIGRA